MTLHFVWVTGRGGQEAPQTVQLVVELFTSARNEEFGFVLLVSAETSRWRDQIRQEGGVNGRGLLAIWRPHSIFWLADMILPQVGNTELIGICPRRGGVGAGDGETIRGRYSAQVWKRLKHITE